MDDRRKLLEAYAKQVSEGNPLSEEFIRPLSEGSFKDHPLLKAKIQGLEANQLAENALSHQVLKNTGIPIPGDLSNRSKTEDFLSRILKEAYPELEPNIEIQPHDALRKQFDGANVAGYYAPSHKDLPYKIVLNETSLHNPNKAVADLLHEGAHQYDDKILGFNGTNSIYDTNLKKVAPHNRLITEIDPTEAGLLMSKGHHARIPDLRDADSFGLGALKSMLKSGRFKQIAGPIVGALPLAGTAMALSSGDANAAAEELPSEIPIVGQVYDAVRSEAAGNADDDKQMIAERNASAGYNKSPARLDAIKKLSGY